MSDRIAAIKSRLETIGQAHLLRFEPALSAAQREALLAQIDRLNLDEIEELIQRFVLTTPDASIPADLAPAAYYPNDATSPQRSYDRQAYLEDGERLIRAGKMAAFCVAGGQGTRLGWNGPKGTFPASAVTGKPLFRIFAEQILASERKYGVTIPWYIMTSPINDADTRAFFADNNCFGLKRRNIFMFPQGVMPSFDKSTGAILLADKGELAVNPDGHGGSIRALADSGATEDMTARGIEHISCFQVDNPLVKIIDPLFIGLHARATDSSAQMSSKMLPKVNAAEKVGVFCESGGKTMVIEYSDLPKELAEQRTADGSLRFTAGSIAIHLIGVAFVDQLTSGDSFGLPWHRAEKKVPHIDMNTGQKVDPTEANGVKLETFVFDAIPLAESSIVYETTRVEEFAPIKNATGVDSAESSAQIQSDRNGNWLEARGVKVARRSDGHVDARIEISPLTGLCAEDIPASELPSEVRAGEEVTL